MKKYFRIILLSGIGVACASESNALTITTLYNTGVDSMGTVLPDGTSPDPHYTLTSLPSGATTVTRVKTSASGYPVGPWLGDDSSSAWIGPNSDNQLNGPVGNYTYQMSFDLTGFNPSTAGISGRWSTDNDGVGIWLNGTQIAGATSSGQFMTGYVGFASASGFVAGLNTLEFVIHNGGGPTGLRVDMTGTADAVPDGGTTLVLLGSALSGLAFVRRKLA